MAGSEDSLESGELPLEEEGEIVSSEPQQSAREPPRPQHPSRDEWAGPRRDGGGRDRSGDSEYPYPARGPPRSDSWGYGPAPRRRGSPGPLLPPGGPAYPPGRGGPRGRYPPGPPGPPGLPPHYDRERGGSRPSSGGPLPPMMPRAGSPPPLPRAVSPPPAQLVPSEAELAARDAREMEGLAADVKQLSRTLTLQACMKDLERVCDDLRSVVRKTSAYLQLIKKRDESVASADDSEALAGLAAGLLSGLRALHVFSNTGQGRRMPAARDPVQAAWRAREQLLTSAQRKQLEGFVSSSKNFAALLDERSPTPEPARRRDYVPAPRPQPPQPKERKQKQQGGAGAGEGLPGQPPALSKRQLKRLQAAQRAEAEAAEAAALKARQLEQAAQMQAQLEAKRKAAEEEAANKRYKLTIKLGTSSLPAAPEPVPFIAATAAVQQQQQQQQPREDAALAAALDDHWRWHHHQQQGAAAAGPAAAGPAGAGPAAAAGLPPLPAEEAAGGWQAEEASGGWQAVDAPAPAEPPLSPMSSPASPAGIGAGAPSAAAAAGHTNGAAAAAGAAPGLNVAALEHAADGSPAVRQLLGQGKLCLVLDLDHTLLNSATFSEVGPAVQAALEDMAAREGAALPDDQRLLFRLDAIKMWTKLRPAVREFLQRASKLFQLWIHTNGNRAYADNVVRLLDPSGTFFGDRIIAQGAERVDQMVADQEKRLMQGLADCESITVIVDDSHSVWSQHRHNLVAVERYIYFPSSRASLGLKGPSLMDTGRDEDSARGMLMVALDVLTRVHAAVMGALAAPPMPMPGGEVVYQNWDVRHALALERQKVLRGVVLVFTRVIPLEMEPSTHPLWRLAESFGARCSGSLDSATTHVVAGASGTEKVLQARAAGKWVVTPAWLECSCILWKRASEERFGVPP